MKLESITHGWWFAGGLLNAIATFSDGKRYRFQWTEKDGILKMAFPHDPPKNKKHDTWDWGVSNKGRIFPARARLIMAAPKKIKNAFELAQMEDEAQKRREQEQQAQEARVYLNAKKITDAGPEAHRIILALHKAIKKTPENKNTIAKLIGWSLATDIAVYEKATRPTP